MKRKLLLKKILLLLLLQELLALKSSAQIVISGSVYDSTKLYAVSGVNVSTTSGLFTVTDSLGAYHISASESDSLSFFYKGKSTVKFPVKTIGNYNAFDISLRVRVNAKYKLLQGVTVFADTYHRDSTENRMEYAKVFNFEKPGISSTFTPGEPAGLNLDDLIGMFSFRKKKENLAFQKRLLNDERDRYVNYRFSSKIINRITGLGGDTLVKYKNLYRPSYEFVVSSTLAQFYEYILQTSYEFKREEEIK